MSNPVLPPLALDDRFQRVVEASPSGVIVVDGSGRIVLVNRQIEAWFQYSRAELVGQLIEILVPDSVRPYHIPWRDGYFQSPRIRPIGSGRDLHARRRDGTEFPCDISLHPLPTEAGQQIMVHIVDITERKRLESEKRQQESIRQLRFMVDNLPAGAVYVSGATIVVNRAVETITGYGREELATVDDWFSRLFGPRSAALADQYIADRAADFPQPRLLELTRKDGSQRWVEMAAYRDQQHEIWLLHDVTEQRIAQERLVQSERLAAIGQMTTTLAHESRNALQRGQACLEMMALDLQGQPELLNLVERTQVALDELQRLYEEVQGYASPLALELQLTDVRSLWEQVWNNLSTARGKKQIEFQAECDSAMAMFRVDRHRVAQVLRNILENSIAVLPPGGGSITIRCGVRPPGAGSGFRLSICDNGPGLNPEQRQRIFEPFYTTKTRGTGLGMAIARRIMDAHGGRISIGECKTGTEIVLEFPD